MARSPMSGILKSAGEQDRDLYLVELPSPASQGGGAQTICVGVVIEVEHRDGRQTLPERVPLRKTGELGGDPGAGLRADHEPIAQPGLDVDQGPEPAGAQRGEVARDVVPGRTRITRG